MDEVLDTFDACKKRWGIEQDQDVNFQRYSIPIEFMIILLIYIN